MTIEQDNNLSTEPLVFVLTLLHEKNLAVITYCFDCPEPKRIIYSSAKLNTAARIVANESADIHSSLRAHYRVAIADISVGFDATGNA